MALVTYKDSTGRSWRVWDVTRTTPASGRTDFLEPEYREGWLCFECEEVPGRVRLADFPKNWATLTPERLDLLRRMAKPMTRRTTPGGMPAVDAPDAARPAEPPEPPRREPER